MQTFAIASALVVHDGKILIAKRAATKASAPGQWEIISGFLDTKEPIEELILRELREETGMRGEITNRGEPYAHTDEEARWIIIPFLIKTKDHDTTLNPGDHSELKWILPEEMEQYPDLQAFLPVKNLL
jgi:8-oxo-dGTP diphosphatase